MQAASNPSGIGPIRWFQPTLLGMLAIALAVLTANVWLLAGIIRQQRSTARERDFWVLCQPGFSAPERETAFRHLVAAGNREWRSADLRGLNLARVALPGGGSGTTDQLVLQLQVSLGVHGAHAF